MSDKQRLLIRLVTAVKLEPEKEKIIVERFAGHYGIDSFDVQSDVDPNLVGGMVIYAGGFRYDYSIRGQLNRIAGRMKEQKTLMPDDKGELLAEAGKIRDSLEDALNLFDEAPMAPGGHDLFWETEAVRDADGAGSDQPVVDQLRQTLDSLSSSAAIDEIGTVISVGDGVAYVSGIENCKSSELIMFAQHSYGIAMNLETDRVGVVILQEGEPICQGMMCKRTGTTVSVPTGKPLLGRVVEIGRAHV